MFSDSIFKQPLATHSVSSRRRPGPITTERNGDGKKAAPNSPQVKDSGSMGPGLRRDDVGRDTALLSRGRTNVVDVTVPVLRRSVTRCIAPGTQHSRCRPTKARSVVILRCERLRPRRTTTRAVSSPRILRGSPQRRLAPQDDARLCKKRLRPPWSRVADRSRCAGSVRSACCRWRRSGRPAQRTCGPCVRNCR